MEKSSFFNDIDDDRVYFAEDFARHLAKYFTNGIFNNELKVIANNDMTVTIQEGDANIEGYRYTNTASLTKTIDTADGSLKRIDNVVIRLDLTNRLISAQIIKGTFSDSPSAPSLVRSSTIYDLKLAEVYIGNGVTSITQANITDTRFNKNMCGNVVSTVETIDTTDVYNQLYTKFEEIIQQETTEFTAWFNRIKNQLDTDAAGHLAAEINKIVDSGLKSYTKTLTVDNWSLNNETNLYEYDIIDSDVTSSTLVNVNLDLVNQVKLNDGMVNSYNGGFKIITSEKPLENIDTTITYQVSNLSLEGI
jgi:hypothetical protein